MEGTFQEMAIMQYLELLYTHIETRLLEGNQIVTIAQELACDPDDVRDAAQYMLGYLLDDDRERVLAVLNEYKK